jgi:hypothetical protein
MVVGAVDDVLQGPQRQQPGVQGHDQPRQPVCKVRGGVKEKTRPQYYIHFCKAIANAAVRVSTNVRISFVVKSDPISVP